MSTCIRFQIDSPLLRTYFASRIRWSDSGTTAHSCRYSGGRTVLVIALASDSHRGQSARVMVAEQRAPWSRRRRIVTGILIALPTLAFFVFFGLLVAAQSGFVRAGCGSVDPTDEGNYSRVAILNDTIQPVVVDQCQGDYCRADQDVTHLEAGARLSVDAACGRSGADATSWRITHDAAPFSYVVVETPRKHDGLVFSVSRASKDRSTPTPAG